MSSDFSDKQVLKIKRPDTYQCPDWGTRFQCNFVSPRYISKFRALYFMKHVDYTAWRASTLCLYLALFCCCCFFLHTPITDIIFEEFLTL